MSDLGTLPGGTEVGGTSDAERRGELRHAVSGSLWMIDHDGTTVLRCHCLEASTGGLRLRVPLGYGVAEGQRYELRSHLPGSRPQVSGFGVIGSRWATVVRTQMRVGGPYDHMEVGVVLDPGEEGSLQPVFETAAMV